jgi:hypothetical protein
MFIHIEARVRRSKAVRGHFPAKMKKFSAGRNSARVDALA